jgi:rhodanese-related sulfurtransferase
VRVGDVTVTADVAIVAVGVAPAIDLASAAGVAIGRTGAISVDERLATSVPGIWAAGDCVEVRHAVTGEPVHLPLGSLANRQGRTLANVLAGRADSFPAVTGAVAVKVFDWNVATAGVTRASARARGIAARSVWVTSHDRAHYWPEAKEIVVHLVYEPFTQRVLGVQIAGAGEAAKRADVAAQLIARRGTLAELAQIEHAYAPAYAPAVEPLAVAAWVAEDCEDGVHAAPPVASLHDRSVLDVRNPDEAAAHPVSAPHVVRVPLGELRRRSTENREGEWLVVCERGARAAEAVRLLQGRGEAAEYLGAGLRFRAMMGEGRAL